MKMKSQNIHSGLLKTHINKYGIEGLLPQYLSATLLKIISVEFANFQGSNIGENNESIAVLLSAVLHLARGEISSINTGKTFEIHTDALYDKINNYGLSIMIEEIRRTDLIEIAEENLPTLNNILDDNRELIATGNDRAINNFIKGFKK